MNKTIFKHDCEHCIYLGPHEDSTGKFDLYYCAQNLQRISVPTVIARYGNSLSEYSSGMDSCIPVLQEAQKRALILGLPTTIACSHETLFGILPEHSVPHK